MLPDYFGRILAPRPWAFLTCDSSRNDSYAPTKNSDGKRRRIFLCRLVLTPRPWAFVCLVVEVIMKAAHRQIVFGRILARRPWAFC